MPSKNPLHCACNAAARRCGDVAGPYGIFPPPEAPHESDRYPGRVPARALGTAAGAADSAASSHVTEVTLAPGEGKEINLAMREGARVNFEWTIAGGVVNFDTHADRPGTRYHGYEKGQLRRPTTGC